MVVVSAVMLIIAGTPCHEPSTCGRLYTVRFEPCRGSCRAKEREDARAGQALEAAVVLRAYTHCPHSTYHSSSTQVFEAKLARTYHTYRMYSTQVLESALVHGHHPVLAALCCRSVCPNLHVVVQVLEPTKRDLYQSYRISSLTLLSSVYGLLSSFSST